MEITLLAEIIIVLIIKAETMGCCENILVVDKAASTLTLSLANPQQNHPRTSIFGVIPIHDLVLIEFSRGCANISTPFQQGVPGRFGMTTHAFLTNYVIVCGSCDVLGGGY